MRIVLSQKSLLLFIVIAVFLINLFFSGVVYSDDLFYFNIAKQVSEGKTVYSDFFFAHPPIHIYLLSTFFSAFGASFFSAKLFTVLVSSLCLILIFLASKKSSLWPVGLLILSSAFISFSRTGYGLFLAVLFILCSLYFMNRRNILLSSLFFAFSVFTQYLSVLYFPVLFLNSKKNYKLLIFSFFLISFGFILCFVAFGPVFFDDTILFHFSTKFLTRDFTFWQQYLSMNLFVLIPIVIFSFRKAVSVLIIDLFFLLFFKAPFYHYFLISIPFYILLLSECKEKRIIVLSFILAILLNLSTISANVLPDSQLLELSSFFSSKSGTIFGSPIPVNFVSFETNLSVLNNQYDSYPHYILFKGEDNLFNETLSNPPEFLILEKEDLSNLNFWQNISNNFISIFNTSEKKYSVFQMKDKSQ